MIAISFVVLALTLALWSVAPPRAVAWGGQTTSTAGTRPRHQQERNVAMMARDNQLANSPFMQSPYTNLAHFLRDGTSTAPARSLGFDKLLNCDIVETVGQYRIEAEVPGVLPSDLEVTVDGSILTIKAHKEILREEDDGLIYHSRECLSGSMERQFELPGNADGDKAGVKLSDGVLLITLPKKEATLPTKTSRSLLIDTSATSPASERKGEFREVLKGSGKAEEKDKRAAKSS